jgi:exopolysaccharide production protein ExoQ
MSERRRLFELIVLGGSVFILSKAVVSYILDRPWPPTEGNPSWELVLAISYVGLTLVLIPWYRETLFVLRRNLPLVAMVLLALLSSLWAQMPGLVLRKSVGLCGATLLGVALAVRLSFLDQLRIMNWMFRIIAVLSLAFVVFLPNLAVTEEGQWMGVFDHKNAMGSMLGLAVLVEWQRPAESRGSKILKIIAFLLYAVLLLHSDSVTPRIALFGAVLLTESYKFATFRVRLPQYAFFVAISIVVMIGLAFVFTNGDSIMGIVGRSSNLTGRTEIWGLTLSFIPQRPILGYGYSGFWLGASPESFVANRIMRGWIMYSHNGYLEQLLNLGIIGLALTLSFLGIGVKRAIKFSEHRHSGTAIWPLAFLFYFILHNTVECSIMIQDIEWALCVSCIAGADPLLFSFDIQEEDEMPLLPMEEPT